MGLIFPSFMDPNILGKEFSGTEWKITEPIFQHYYWWWEGGPWAPHLLDGSSVVQSERKQSTLATPSIPGCRLPQGDTQPACVPAWASVKQEKLSPSPLTHLPFHSLLPLFFFSVFIWKGTPREDCTDAGMDLSTLTETGVGLAQIHLRLEFP